MSQSPNAFGGEGEKKDEVQLRVVVESWLRKLSELRTPTRRFEALNQRLSTSSGSQEPEYSTGATSFVRVSARAKKLLRKKEE
jgi:hypothetical protein